MDCSEVLVPRISPRIAGHNPFEDNPQIPLLTLHPLPDGCAPVPVVTVACFHSSQALHLRFMVTETPVRALITADNGPVWEDSCVEFFVQPDAGPLYYNFEFNPFGWCLLECGTSRLHRQQATPEVLKTILRQPSITPDLLGLSIPVSWSLEVVIPCEAFFSHSILCLDGLRMSANFYKCGSALPFPHYLSWSPMPMGKPDFHQTQFFGCFNTGV